MLSIVLVLFLVVALIGFAVAARRAAAYAHASHLIGTERDQVVTERDGLRDEVEELRPLEVKLAVAQATIDAKDESWTQASAKHDEEIVAFREQRETLTQMSERLTTLSQQTKDAAEKGGDAAKGSKRTEELFAGWTKSISNPQSRGALGELAIERQLVDLGLVKGRDFISQEPGNDGLRRDMVIRAGEVRVVVDSKWTADPSLGELSEALQTGEVADLAEWGKKLRGRAKDLAKRHYARGQDKGPRLVLMYVPVEGACEALEAVKDFSLEKFSRETGVYVITPSQLGLAISVIAELWRDGRREEQLAEIARELSGMGEQTAKLVEDLDAMGRSIRAVVNYYNRIVGRVTTRGGVFQQAKVVFDHVGRRFKKDVLHDADGEVLRIEQPRDDVGQSAGSWRAIEGGGTTRRAS
jgi:DNA anti-recombination protein RmuC